jgi:hypothetical protein
MNNLVTRSHIITFSPIKTENGYYTPDQIKITPEQYQALKQVIVSDRFVEINGELFNSSAIRSVEKIPEPPKRYLERWMYDSDEDYYNDTNRKA